VSCVQVAAVSAPDRLYQLQSWPEYP